MILRVLVADDEAPAREEIVYLLGAIGDVDVVGQASNGVEALRKAEDLAPDLLFLDIRMPGLDGFQVVRALAALEKSPAVIFVTAYDTHAIEAFNVNAIDYLLKPVDTGRLAEAVARARERLRAGRNRAALASAADLIGRLQPAAPGGRPRQPPAAMQRITVKNAGRYLVVDGRAVRYARMNEGVMEVHAESVRGTMSLRTLDELEGILPAPTFFRAHRAYLVNLDHVAEVVPWFSGRLKLRMDDEKRTEIPVSRSRAKQLREILKM